MAYFSYIVLAVVSYGVAKNLEGTLIECHVVIVMTYFLSLISFRLGEIVDNDDAHM